MDNTQSLVDIVKRFVPDVTEGELANLVVAQKTNPNVVDAFIKQRMKPTDAPMDASTRIPAPVNLPTQLKSPWAGTTQEAQNPLNPAANTISQFDPRLQRDAEARFAEMYKNQAGDRALTGGLMGFGSGVTGLQASNKMWDEKNKHLFDMMVISEERARKAATDGLAAATSQQNMSKQAGEFQKDMAGAQLDQEKKRLELITTGLGAEQLQRLNQPDSIDTKAVKVMLLNQISNIPAADKASVQEIVKMEGVTAMQLLPILEKYAPAVANAYYDKLGGQKTVAETGLVGAQTGKTNAETGLVGAQTGKTSAETGLVGAQTGKTRAETKGVELGVKAMDTATEGGTKLPPGYVPSFNSGPMSMSSPQAQAESTAEGQRRVGVSDRAEIWTNYGKPGIDRVRDLVNSSYTGKGSAALATILNADKQVELITELSKLNAMYPEMFPPSVAAELKKAQSETGYSGRLLSSMSNTVLNSLLNKYETDMIRQFSSAANRNEAVDKGARSVDVPMANVPKPLPKVTNDAEYNALPVGAQYVAPDGKIYTKNKGSK